MDGQSAICPFLGGQSLSLVIVSVLTRSSYCLLIYFAFITGNSSLEPLLEGLLAQIHVNLR